MKSFGRLFLVALAVTIILAARKSLDIVPRGVYIAAAIVAVPAILPPIRLGRKKKRNRSKALYSGVSELADAIEEGDATIDSTIKAILQDVRDTLSDASDSIAGGEYESATETIDDLTYDIDRALAGRTTQ